MSGDIIAINLSSDAVMASLYEEICTRISSMSDDAPTTVAWWAPIVVCSCAISVV
jgi:hypothetical protein